jgi:hypothetical protein
MPRIRITEQSGNSGTAGFKFYRKKGNTSASKKSDPSDPKPDWEIPDDFGDEKKVKVKRTKKHIDISWGS